MLKKIVVISGPSGTGKTTICDKIEQRIPNSRFVISVTTRKRRKSEKEGEQYYFVSREKFKEMVKNNEFIEWEEVHGNFYGTPKIEMYRTDLRNEVLIIDVDPKGAVSIKKEFPDSILIFIAPPSVEELYKRLKDRKTELEEAIKKRMSRIPEEMAYSKYFDFKVVNADIENTVNKVIQIIKGD